MAKCAKRFTGLVMVLAFFMALSVSAHALSNVPEKDIPIGSSGEAVKQLQEALKELSFYTGEITGVYDTNTTLCVKKLQQQLSLTVDGLFTKQTAEALNIYIDKKLDEEAAKQKPLKGYKIGIDPGHQLVPDDKYEAIAPGSSSTKERMSAGAVGAKTGTQEYEINLLVANKLKKKLENAGATVVMTRTKHDVSLSNIDRAKMMNEEKVDFWLRLHADYSADKDATGAHAIAPSKLNAPQIANNSLLLSKKILVQFSKATGAKRNAVVIKEDQVGMNWSNAPVSTVEMGYLSNPLDDAQLNRDSYQNACAKGLYNGITAYVEETEKIAAQERSEAER
ncbi:N-acetylmuramoyl-L-alanine amidase [Christensenellaceae bacterium OttesenSCG-928-M15]|nr:N-acetylmuramoyl-L-alanine amidase [Christensenellaceae bacterium OttesenSCG-928-M15]